VFDTSPGALFCSLLLGSLGFGLLLYGKKQRRVPQTVSGIALMVFPYFVSDVPLMLGIGGAIVAATWLAVRLGAQP